VAPKVQIKSGVHKLANYQTGGYKFRPMSGWNGKIISLLNAPTKSTLKHDDLN